MFNDKKSNDYFNVSVLLACFISVCLFDCLFVVHCAFLFFWFCVYCVVLLLVRCSSSALCFYHAFVVCRCYSFRRPPPTATATAATHTIKHKQNNLSLDCFCPYPPMLSDPSVLSVCPWHRLAGLQERFDSTPVMVESS